MTSTRGIWEELRGARVFLTGGTGVIGTWLLESFAWANRSLGLGAEALVLTRDAETFQKRMPHLAGLDSITFHSGDVRTFEFPPGDCSHLIHAATTSSSHPARVDPEEMLETIIAGTTHTLAFARHAGVRKVLFTSSGAVCGRRPPDHSRLEEDDPFAPDPLEVGSAYGEGKRLAELLCALAYRRHGLETKVARCFTFVGPLLPLDAHFAVGNFLRDGLRRGPIRVRGDGTPFRSYLHLADLMIWLWTILVSGRPGRAYNVGSDRALTIADLAGKVADLFGVGVEIDCAAVPDQPAPRYVPSIRRAAVELGLEVRIDLDDALARTKQYLLQSSDLPLVRR